MDKENPGVSAKPNFSCCNSQKLHFVTAKSLEAIFQKLNKTCQIGVTFMEA
jgi:hypothetical protein